MAEKEGELADLRAQLARVQGNDPTALAVLEETAEVPPRHT
jgi:hypothetical protein